MSGNREAGTDVPIRIRRLVYGGLGVGHNEHSPAAQETLLVPFVLPGELVQVCRREDACDAHLERVLEPSTSRVKPGCPHFGMCGGCHLQMGSDAEQLRIKHDVLLDSLRRAGVSELPPPEVHAGEPWGYRNRIRLRLERIDGQLRFGYTQHGKGRVFLPIVTCPIAAPVLWYAAERLLDAAARDVSFTPWMDVTREVELFTDAVSARLQITFLCSQPPSLPRKALTASFERAMPALARDLASEVELAGAGAVQATWNPLRLGRTIAEWGAPGLAYRVSKATAEESYWVERGGFFQVNRFLVPKLVVLVCADRSGRLAWDLFAGVGLFARVLARRFQQVIAVEPHARSAAELRRSLARLGHKHQAEEKTSVAFLEGAVLQRERPELIVLDPPRAGAGLPVCELLLRIAAAQVVYVSCDPVTLGRDLALLQRGYTITALHLVDLFPQTYHQEAVVLLKRRT